MTVMSGKGTNPNKKKTHIKSKPARQKAHKQLKKKIATSNKMKKTKERVDKKKDAAKPQTHDSNKEVKDKLKALITLEKKGNLKKPLTERQKHKLLKLKLKRKAKKAGKKQKKKSESKSEPTIDSSSKLTVLVPQTPQEASSNWKKLQKTTISKADSSKKKRKLSPERIRNPKYRKVAEGETSESQPDAAVKKPDIWFDDVDEFLLEGDSRTTSADATKEKLNPLVKPEAFKGLTKAVAMDCEMVGVGDGSDSMLARVSVVNQHGEPVYDRYVKPKEKVVDYRTHVSGIRPGDMEKGDTLEKVQKDVADILKGRILVGHAIQNDLKVLFLQHPRRKIRDTSRYKAFRRLFQGRTPSLKNLSSTVLKVAVQEGEHNSVQDAQAAMRLYTMFRQQWESELKVKRIRGRGGDGGGGATKGKVDDKPG